MRRRFAALAGRLLGALSRDEAGQIAVTFALVLVPILLAIGASIDISQAMTARTRLGEALDSAGLAVASTVGLQDAQKTALASKFLYANYPGTEIGTVTELTVTSVTSPAPGVRLTGTSRVKTSFMGLVGVSSLDVNVNVEVVSEAKSLDVVLVLDTTGSMSGTKITTLKKAATDLANKLMVGNTVKIGVVPFARYVNIGLGNRNIPGVSVPADTTSCTTVNQNVKTCTGSISYTGTCSKNVNPQPATCYNDGAPYTCTKYDTVTYPCTKTTPTGCTTKVVPKTSCTSQTWNGCVGSRPPPNNATDSNFGSVNLPGLMNISCSKPIVRLTNSKVSVTSSIAGLTATDNTYIPAGLSVGWHVLSPGIPFTDATPNNGNLITRRAMVLMTDGDNTVSLTGTGPLHNAASRPAADAVTSSLCTQIKADGVEVYTVAFQITDTATKNMIRNCASSPANYFDASDPVKLLAAFENITMALSNLRLTR